MVSATAYGVSALLLRRSVLTEKIARRGYHLTREYDVDPLEVLLVDEVMHPTPAALVVTDPLPAPMSLLLATVPRPADPHPMCDLGDNSGVADPLQRLFPVVGDGGELVGVVPRQALVGLDRSGADLAAILVADPVTVHADDTLRTVASVFAQHAVTAAPVVDRADAKRLLGLITVDHLLDGRLRDLAEEHHRERLITTPPWGPRGRRPRVLARQTRGRHEG